MKIKLLILLLVVVFTGCATNRPADGGEVPVRTEPVITDQSAATPSKSIPSKSIPSKSIPSKSMPSRSKPPIVISRVEPTPAVNQVIAKARSARESGRYDQALLLLDRAQRMAPKAGEVYLEMARVNRQTGQLAKAEQLCLKAISLSGPDQRFRRQAKRELAFVRRARNS